MDMLSGLTTVTLLILGLLLWVTFNWFRSFSRFIDAPGSNDVMESDLPHTLVILCLRGCDPFLLETLRALAGQTCRNFDLRVVIDHQFDRSVAVVEEFQRETGFDRLQIRYLHQRRRTCGLKVSALLQELSHLDTSYQAIVQVDADAVPYPGWLKEMLTPLRDPRVGVTSGVRWYMPYQSNWASLVRYVWGISATVQMHRFGMPWGGSMAFRRELLTETQLLSLWKRSLTEDLVMDAVLQQSGLRLHYVPAIMVNREETNFKDCYSFIRRQVLLARYYHASWGKVASYALVSGGSLLAVFLLKTMAIRTGNAAVFWAGWIGSLSYLFLFAGMIHRTERIIRCKLVRQGAAVTPLDYRYLLAQPFALMMHVASTISAMLSHRVSWRGVAYQLSRGGRVTMLHDEPLVEEDAARQASIV